MKEACWRRCGPHGAAAAMKWWATARSWCCGARDGWRCCPGASPREKVLALLVEHLGEIPEGAAWKVYKKQGAQAQMVDMALEAVDTIRRELEEDPDPRRVNRTAMNWKGREIWQTEKLEVYAYDPEQTAVGAGDAMAFDGRLVWDDEGGLLVLDPKEGVIDEALRERLEQLPLA